MKGATTGVVNLKTNTNDGCVALECYRVQMGLSGGGNAARAIKVEPPIQISGRADLAVGALDVELEPIDLSRAPAPPMHAPALPERVSLRISEQYHEDEELDTGDDEKLHMNGRRYTEPSLYAPTLRFNLTHNSEAFVGRGAVRSGFLIKFVDERLCEGEAIRMGTQLSAFLYADTCISIFIESRLDDGVTNRFGNACGTRFWCARIVLGSFLLAPAEDA